MSVSRPYDPARYTNVKDVLTLAASLEDRIAELEAALTTIRDTLPIEQDNYSRRVFAIAANALEPEAR